MKASLGKNYRIIPNNSDIGPRGEIGDSGHIGSGLVGNIISY